MELVRVAKLTTIDNFRLEDCHYALKRWKGHRRWT